MFVIKAQVSNDDLYNTSQVVAVSVEDAIEMRALVYEHEEVTNVTFDYLPYINEQVGPSTRTHTQTNTRTYAHTNKHTHVRTHKQTHARTHTQINTHAHAHMHNKSALMLVILTNHTYFFPLYNVFFLSSNAEYSNV